MLRYEVLVRVKGSNADWESATRMEKKVQAVTFAKSCERPCGNLPVYETKIVDVLKKGE